MCGIAGVFSRITNHDNQRIVRNMVETLEHRGPDDSGIYSDDVVTLGHSRLAILDRSEAGKQPMTVGEGRYQIVFNGEIYNYIELRTELQKLGHTFCTESDTEVILHAYEHWGRSCVERFNGMWSLAIWDRVDHELFCARDRLGVKPFVYYYDSQMFVFASEIKALLRHPDIEAVQNNQAIYDFIVYRQVDHTSETFFKGIFQLPAAHCCIVNEQGVSLFRYWDLSDSSCFAGSLDEAGRELRDLVLDSVRLRFRSDVEVGACLSGGLDSSSIVCAADWMMKEGSLIADHKLRTFSLVSSYERFDESRWIDTVNDYTSTINIRTSPTDDDLLNHMYKLIEVQEEPFGSTSVFGQYMVMQKIHQSGIKVTLDGQGADELFGGYLKYADAYFADLMRTGDHYELDRQITAFCTTHGLSSEIAMERAKNLLTTKSHNRHMEYNEKFLSLSFAHSYRKIKRVTNKFSTFLQNELYQDLVSDSIPSLLRYEDRNSMAFSIESRVPFLDYRMVEFAFSLPPSMKMNNATTKVVLRKAMEGIIPREITERRDKMGFVTPEAVWFRGKMEPILDQVIYSKSIEDRNLFDIKMIRDMWEAFKTGKSGDSQLIWRIVSVELWLRMFIDRNNH